MPWDLFPFFMNLNSLDPERDRATRLLSSIFCSKDSTWAVMNRLKHFRKFFCFVKIFDYKVRKSPVNRAGRLRQFSQWRAKMSRHQKIVACRFFCWLFRCVVVVTLSLTWWNTFANLHQNINKCFLSWWVRTPRIKRFCEYIHGDESFLEAIFACSYGTQVEVFEEKKCQ